MIGPEGETRKQLARFAKSNNLPLSIPDVMLMEISNAFGPKVEWKKKYMNPGFINVLAAPEYGLRVFQQEGVDPSTFVDTFDYYNDSESGKPLTRMLRKEYAAGGEIKLPIFEQRRIFDAKGSLVTETVGEVVDTFQGQTINPIAMMRLTKVFPNPDGVWGTAYATMYYSSQFHFITGQTGEVVSYLEPTSDLIVTQSSKFEPNGHTVLPADINEVTNSGINFIRSLFANPVGLNLLPEIEECLGAAYCADLLVRAKTKFPEAFSGDNMGKSWKANDQRISFNHKRFGKIILPRAITLVPAQYGIMLPVNYSLS